MAKQGPKIDQRVKRNVLKSTRQNTNKAIQMFDPKQKLSFLVKLHMMKEAESPLLPPPFIWIFGGIVDLVSFYLLIVDYTY
jgi:hypothetical protein